VNDARRAIAPRTRRAPSRPAGGLAFAFCCFNNNYKILPPVVGAWMRLLRDVPQSVLWAARGQRGGEASTCRRPRAGPRHRSGAAGVRAAAAAGRAPGAAPRGGSFLDTLPYNAHTTASDALWDGLPVVTCAGATFRRTSGRQRAVRGRPGELVTASPQEYEALALALAARPGRLGQGVPGARGKGLGWRTRASAPLFDTDRFRRGLEAAYMRPCGKVGARRAPEGLHGPTGRGTD